MRANTHNHLEDTIKGGAQTGTGQFKHRNQFAASYLISNKNLFLTTIYAWMFDQAWNWDIRDGILSVMGSLAFIQSPNNFSALIIRNYAAYIEHFTECVPVNCHHCVIWWSRWPFTKWTGTWLVFEQSCFTTHDCSSLSIVILHQWQHSVPMQEVHRTQKAR